MKQAMEPFGYDTRDPEALAQAEKVIQDRTLKNGRSCGECTLCCKVMDVPQIGKPAHKWCRYAEPKKGCKIYADRPNVCRGFACLWLLGQDKVIPSHWRPNKCHMVLAMDKYQDAAALMVLVDPSYPDVWRKSPFVEEIIELSRNGLTAANGIHYATIVGVKERKWLVLPPNQFKEITGKASLVFPISEDRWEAFVGSVEELKQKKTVMETAMQTVLRYSDQRIEDLKKANPSLTDQMARQMVVNELQSGKEKAEYAFALSVSEGDLMKFHEEIGGAAEVFIISRQMAAEAYMKVRLGVELHPKMKILMGIVSQHISRVQSRTEEQRLLCMTCEQEFDEKILPEAVMVALPRGEDGTQVLTTPICKQCVGKYDHEALWSATLEHLRKLWPEGRFEEGYP